VSSAYINELRRHQQLFLEEITEPPEETLRRQQAYDAWVASTFKPKEG
jgi:hypothetical protein